MGYTNEQIRRFLNAFVGRHSDYAQQRLDGSYMRMGRALLKQDIQEHLAGQRTLGTYVMDEQGLCSFVVFDADMPQGIQVLWELQQRLARLHLASYLERSRRGGHAWMFLEEKTPASVVRRWLRPHCPAGVEFYPKQDEGKGYGSLIRLPLGVHQVSGDRYPFVEVTSSGVRPVAGSVAKTLDSWLQQVRRVPVPDTLTVPGVQHETGPHQEKKLLSRSLPVVPHPPSPLRSSSVPLTIREWNAQQNPFEVIGNYIALDRKGQGCCPFGSHHDNGQDEHASFKVYEPLEPGGYCWYCYVSRQGGSVFDFLRRYYGLEARELWKLVRAGGQL